MTRLTVSPAAFAVLCGLTAPAFAHEGLLHDGCAAHQSFAAGELTITGAYTRAMLPSAKVAGGYLSIENKGSAPDRLLGGTSEAAASIEVHEMKMDGDMMKMAEVAGGLEIPAGGAVSLMPGGFHLMMMGVHTPFTEGQCVEVTLLFEKAGEVPVVLGIGGIAAAGAPEGGMSMDMPADHKM